MAFPLRYIFRGLARTPVFTVAVVLTLGLGIGANTAIFSVVRGVMLKPLPHRDGDRLVYLRQSASGPGSENLLFSVPEINDFREASKTLGQIAEYSGFNLTMLAGDEASRIDVGLVTSNYFAVMGLSPITGRRFTTAEDGAGAKPVMMLTYEFWKSRFAGDTGIVGQSLRVGGHEVEVVGVLQSAPFFPDKVDAIMNMVNSEHHLSATMITGRTHRMTEMIARLAPDATVEQAQSEVSMIASRVHADNPESYDPAAGYKVTLTPLKTVLGQNAQLTLWLLMGAAAFVLIIGCANVANLTLMRSVRREHEMLVRAALGAGTSRLRRLLLAENLVLAFMGALLGVAVAYAGVGMLIRFTSRYTPRASEISVDAMVLGFAFLLAVVVAFLLSYVPKLTSESSLGAGLSAGTTRTSGGKRKRRLQQALVVTQIAVSVVLLTGAGLLVRSMQALAAVDPGLNTANVLTVPLPRDVNTPEEGAAAKVAYEQMRYQLAALPGVNTVGLGSTVPLRTAGFLLDVKAEGREVVPGEPTPHAEYRTAAPGYFKASGIPLLKGADFTDANHADNGLVVIINETLANRLFPNRDPIGRQIAWTGDVLRFIGVSDAWRTVVGVVGDTKDGALDAVPLPVVFVPFAQADFPSGAFVIRAEGDAASLAPAVRSVVKTVAPQQPIGDVLTLDQIRDESVGPRRLNALLIGSFSILALVMAAIGIAAVLAFSVSTRTNEIGIRMSLGADPWRVQRMIIKEGGAMVVVGLTVGIFGSVVFARLVQSLLFGVTPYDPATLVAVILVMAAIGIAACWLPAIRASRIHPNEALRSS